MDGLDNEFFGEVEASLVSFSLDDYADLFSDFDPRPYSERMLSEDFLYELKRASVDKEEAGLALIFLLPKEKRNAGHEHTIKERLRGHFKRHLRRMEEKIKGERKTGFRMVVLGIVFMFLATYFLFYTEKNAWMNFVVVLLEPAGWFTFWEGLNLIVFRTKEIAPDLGFYRKMTSAKISFRSPP
jgi:hypothetical protein